MLEFAENGAGQFIGGGEANAYGIRLRVFLGITYRLIIG